MGEATSSASPESDGVPSTHRHRWWHPAPQRPSRSESAGPIARKPSPMRDIQRPQLPAATDGLGGVGSSAATPRTPADRTATPPRLARNPLHLSERRPPEPRPGSPACRRPLAVSLAEG
jgi:hypothetical protein